MSSFWKLHVINCWTQGPARYFADRIPAAMGMDIPVRDIGFQASEGVFGIPLHSTWDGAVAWVGGHLMELKHSESGRVIPVHEAERDTPYSLVVSTTSGLCRYDMNDRVEVVGRYQNTPVLRFLGKAPTCPLLWEKSDGDSGVAGVGRDTTQNISRWCWCHGTCGGRAAVCTLRV